MEQLSRPDAAELLAEHEDPVDIRGAQKDMRGARQTLDELASALGTGALDIRSWQVASEAARARLAAAEDILSRAVTVNPVAGLVGAAHPEAAWSRLDLSQRRAVVAYLMTVTILLSKKGRQPGVGYWDPNSVRIEWK
ncbi:hypothetical protein [Streptomyces sp. NBC_01727]|uniref:hypothetical protein n=1 Tax=unclassified Streptomyces TaxID=2593676 RepID=UPI002E1270CD|nr:hypothetical protein OIE76_00370 [Streptomyces sp. NBC_01727]